MPNILSVLPELEGAEMVYAQSLIKDMTDDEALQFAAAYRSRRQDPQTILLLALLGFLGFAGIHRFILGHIGLGLLYLLTAGICLIGTIVDLVDYKSLAFEYNQKRAMEISRIIRGDVVTTQ
jgi:TM2 domain-containing membrane protein YozV